MTTNEDILESHTLQIRTLTERIDTLSEKVAFVKEYDEYIKTNIEEIKDQLIDVNQKLYIFKIVYDFIRSNWKFSAMIACLLIFVMDATGHVVINALLKYLKMS